MQVAATVPLCQAKQARLREWARLLGCWLVLLVLWHSSGEAQSAAPERLFVTSHPAMGTTWQLYLYAVSPEVADEISNEVFDEVDRLDDLLSNYRQGSEISRINRLAAQQTVVTDAETFRFLSQAQHWSKVSNGAFDLTVGRLMKSWGFFRKSGRVPTQAEFSVIRQSTGWRKVMLDRATRGVHFTSPGIELDPGGIGKGFAVDAVLKLLRDAGVTRAMISAGSSTIGAIGAPPAKEGWPIVVHDPWRPEEVVSTVMLRDMTLSTANCAEKNFTLAGHRYCHIMNSQTLRPVEGVLQVTILDPSATASDALSNVLFVQSLSKSAELLQSLPQDRALIVTGTEDHRVCTALRWSAPIAEKFCSGRE